MRSQTIRKTDRLSPSIGPAEKPAANPFDTSHLMTDIKGRSVRGGAVTIGAEAVKFILNTGSTMILARLLTPADFGLIAMVSAFTEFVNLFKDLGLSMATIQKENITHQQVSTLFWINIAMSILLTFIAVAISPFVAWFYGEPRLALITIAIGCTFIFGGLIAQHTALMRRQMRFRTLAVIEIVSIAAGIAAAVIAALSGLSYWSLVIMTPVRGIISVVMVWSQSHWRPGRPGRVDGVWPMLAFGGGLTGSNILSYFTRNADNVIVGYALGSAALGIYSKAYGLLTLPMSQINAPLQSVMIPALSRLQAEPQRYRQYYLQALAAIAMITMPIVTFLFTSADEIVHIILGGQWTEAVTVFRWLAPAAFLSTIHFAPGWLCITLGRADIQLRWSMLSAPVIVTGFLVGVNWGVNGVAGAFSATWCLLFVLFIYWACRESPVRFYDIIHTLAIPVLSSLLAAFCTMLIPRFEFESNVFVRLAVNGLAFTACYFGCVMATSKGRQLVWSVISILSVLRTKPK